MRSMFTSIIHIIYYIPERKISIFRAKIISNKLKKSEQLMNNFIEQIKSVPKIAKAISCPKKMFEFQSINKFASFAAFPRFP